MLAAIFFSLSYAVTGKVCVKAVTEYTDTNIASDYFGALQNRPLRGVLIEVKENFGAGTIYFARTDTTGADKGCASFAGLNGAYANTYTVRVTADQLVDGAEVKVYDSQNPTDRWREILDADEPFQGIPAAVVTINYVVDPESHWSIVAATGWALHQSTGGLGSAISTSFFTPGTNGVLSVPGGCGSNGCIDGDDIYMSAARAKKEHFIVYGLGLSFFEAMGGVNFTTAQSEPLFNGTAPLHLAGPQDLLGSLYAGYGHIYDAIVFNDTTDADCEVSAWQDTNWDLMGAPCYTETESLDGQAISCAVGRAPLAPAWGQMAYYVANGYTPPGTPQVTTPIDVTRLWWQAIQDHGMNFEDITSVYSATTPGSWGIGNPPAIRAQLNTQGFMTTTEYDALEARHLY